MNHGAIFGAIVGFIASQWPSIMDMLRDHFGHKRDLEAKEQEYNAAKEGLELARTQNENDTIQTLLDQQEQFALQKQDADTANSCGIMAALRSSVRPILTYGFFLLFVIVKLIAIHHAFVVDHATASTILPLVWDDDAESLFAAVMSFWFGQRSVSEAYEQRKRSTTQVVDSLRGHNDGVPVRDR